MLDLQATRPAGPGPTPVADAPPRRPWRVLLLGCAVVAALSLLGPRALTYDPTAWLIWGREIIHGSLETRYGPSWKPLPMLFTTPFSLFGHDAAALLWLVVARTGALMALILAFRLARRLAGPVAGVLAAAGLGLSAAYVSFAIRGQSEGLLAAASLGAVERHLDGRRGQAFALAVVAALCRPEVWPLLALYALWLLREAPDMRARVRFAAVAVASGAAVIALWVVPEYIGSDQWLRAASRARIPVEGMPAEAAVPFLAVFTNAADVLWAPLLVGAVVAVVLALRARPRDDAARLVLVLAAIAVTIAVLVALLTQTVGFTGTARYLIVPIAMLAVIGGAGLVQAWRLVRGRLDGGAQRAALGVAAAVCLVLAFGQFTRVADSMTGVLDEAEDNGTLPELIAAAGGRQGIIDCGKTYTRGFQTQLMAWELRVPERGVALGPEPPGTMIMLKGEPLLDDDRFPHRIETKNWVLASTCALPGTG